MTCLAQSYLFRAATLAGLLLATQFCWPGAAPSRARAATKESTMKVSKAPFGKTTDGAEVDAFTLTNGRGVTVKIITYGALIASVKTPDRSGTPSEITLGFDTLAEYLAGHPYFGAICGRVANRIAAGKFSVDGVDYQVATNNGPNHLHGGLKGFDKAVWRAESIQRPDSVGVKLTHRSPDGDEGYPGNLDVTVTYTLNDRDELKIDYVAKTDKATPINLTNHAYWNLADGGASEVGKHLLTLAADRYLPVDAGAIPTGELKPVMGTPMDFTIERAIGERIDQVGGEPGGYDHCFVLSQKPSNKPLLAATVVDPGSGRKMEVWTTEPGIQLYTGNFLDGSLQSRGATFAARHGFCLETQHFPDAINQPKFPPVLLRPGKTYRQTTIHRFSAN